MSVLPKCLLVWAERVCVDFCNTLKIPFNLAYVVQADQCPIVPPQSVAMPLWRLECVQYFKPDLPSVFGLLCRPHSLCLFRLIRVALQHNGPRQVLEYAFHTYTMALLPALPTHFLMFCAEIHCQPLLQHACPTLYLGCHPTTVHHHPLQKPTRYKRDFGFAHTYKQNGVHAHCLHHVVFLARIPPSVVSRDQ